MDYPGGSSVITKGLYSGREEAQSHRKCDNRSRNQRGEDDATLLVLKVG